LFESKNKEILAFRWFSIQYNGEKKKHIKKKKKQIKKNKKKKKTSFKAC